ncbi:MAG: PEP-CTERM sorting domain-containing protein [Parvularculaceae bacterium]|nr:PEP-CTERM sorting domain-containing protein [Parvularculaceae bacterium]
MLRSLKLSTLSRGGLAAAALAIFAAAPAQARTAEFFSSSPYGPSALTALSSATDGAGPLVTLDNWIALLFDQPFGTSRSDSVSIFTLPPPVGDARLTVSFGRIVGGLPVFVETRSFNAGNTFTIGNLFQQGCFALGGCNYIFIETTRQRRGAPGAVIDYVSVNGEPTEVIEPTPEPAIWAMMMIGFAGIAWRMKTIRRARAGISNRVKETTAG